MNLQFDVRCGSKLAESFRCRETYNKKNGGEANKIKRSNTGNGNVEEDKSVAYVSGASCSRKC